MLQVDLVRHRVERGLSLGFSFYRVVLIYGF